MAHMVFKAELLFSAFKLRPGASLLSDLYSHLRFFVAVQPHPASLNAQYHSQPLIFACGRCAVTKLDSWVQRGSLDDIHDSHPCR